MIASPCINVCTLDAEGRTCLGCLRTIDEIATWGSMAEDEKARVVADLPSRGRKAAACSRCGAPFACGADDSRPCWCGSLPPVPPSAALGGCLCPACLAEAAATERRSHG